MDEIARLTAEVEEARREARRFYLADGSYIELEPAEVIERRKAAAVESAGLARLLSWTQACVVRAAHGLALALKGNGIDGADLAETAAGVAAGLMDVDAAMTKGAAPASDPRATPEATREDALAALLHQFAHDSVTVHAVRDYRCAMCGEQAESAEGIEHMADCLVLAAAALLAHPPQGGK